MLVQGKRMVEMVDAFSENKLSDILCVKRPLSATRCFPSLCLVSLKLFEIPVAGHVCRVH